MAKARKSGRSKTGKTRASARRAAPKRKTAKTAKTAKSAKARGKTAQRAAAKKPARKRARTKRKPTRPEGLGERIVHAVDAVLDTLSDAERLHTQTTRKGGFQELE